MDFRYKLPIALADKSPRQILSQLVQMCSMARYGFASDHVRWAEEKRIFNHHRPAPGQIVLMQSKEVRDKLKEIRSDDLKDHYDIYNFFEQWYTTGIGNVRRKTFYKLGV